MSLFNQSVGGYGNSADSKAAMERPYKPRTFREQIQDQIVSLEIIKADLQAVLDSLTPEVEKFVEAIQKIS